MTIKFHFAGINLHLLITPVYVSRETGKNPPAVRAQFLLVLIIIIITCFRTALPIRSIGKFVQGVDSIALPTLVL